MSMIEECPWDVMHQVGEEEEHLAWHQRAFLIGDFAPKQEKPSSFYVVDPETGLAVDPREDPVCATCGEIPQLQSLIVVERVTGRRDFLRPYKAGFVAWPKPTDPNTCWWCNSPQSRTALGDVPICKGCIEHLRRF